MAFSVKVMKGNGVHDAAQAVNMPEKSEYPILWDGWDTRARPRIVPSLNRPALNWTFLFAPRSGYQDLHRVHMYSCCVFARDGWGDK